jgi:para-nitrobenzyl esterase
MRHVMLACAVAGALGTLIATANADPIKVSGGLVSGVTLPGGVEAYRGIPFAKPPVGELRWRAPEPASPWPGTLEAKAFGPICFQPPPLGGHSFFTELFFNPMTPMSEDCLTLNVWTTARAGDKRPVMVWIPGGGFRGGSAAGAIYDGADLPLNFHPAAIRASADVTPFGAVSVMA